MKKMVFGLIGGAAILSSSFLNQSTILNENLFSSSKQKEVNNVAKQEASLTIDSVIADINMVTINYSVSGDMEAGTALYIYSSDGQSIAYDPHLSGTITIKNLDYNIVYSGWVASLNYHFTIYDQKIIDDFQPLKEHLINKISINNIDVGNTDSTIFYTLDTNIPLKEEIRIEIKDGANKVISSGIESNLNGKITVDGLEEDTLYQGWKIVATDINYIEVNANSMVDSFITDTHYFVKDLAITSTEVDASSVTVDYSIDSNVEVENLVINLLDESEKIVATGMQSELGGTIKFNDLSENTWYRNWSLYAEQKDHPRVSTKITLDDFKSPLANPKIDGILDLFQEQKSPTSMSFYYETFGNLDAEDYRIKVLDENNQVLAQDGVVDEDNTGIITVEGLSAGILYENWTIQAYYLYDSSVSAFAKIFPFVLE